MKEKYLVIDLVTSSLLSLVVGVSSILHAVLVGSDTSIPLAGYKTHSHHTCTRRSNYVSLSRKN